MAKKPQKAAPVQAPRQPGVGGGIYENVRYVQDRCAEGCTVTIAADGGEMVVTLIDSQSEPFADGRGATVNVAFRRCVQAAVNLMEGVSDG